MPVDINEYQRIDDVSIDLISYSHWRQLDRIVTPELFDCFSKGSLTMTVSLSDDMLM